jgi:hypothetical protein
LCLLAPQPAILPTSPPTPSFKPPLFIVCVHSLVSAVMISFRNTFPESSKEARCPSTQQTSARVCREMTLHAAWS